MPKNYEIKMIDGGIRLYLESTHNQTIYYFRHINGDNLSSIPFPTILISVKKPDISNNAVISLVKTLKETETMKKQFSDQFPDCYFLENPENYTRGQLDFLLSEFKSEK
ncbi:MAG: hypothetical protein WD048_00775 [Chitinophagales bacterium]